MIFKRRRQKHPPPPPQTGTVIPSVPPSLADKAEAVVRALRSFEETAYAEGFEAAGDDLIKARAAVEAATKIVREGRLGYALLRQLLHEVEHWPSWSKRDDFELWKNFECVLLEAKREEIPQKHRNEVLTTVSFTFSGRYYKLAHLDKGWSPVPDASYKWGEVSFFADELLVLEVTAISEATEDHWTFETVKALRVRDGQWMTDILQIASDIESRKVATQNKFFDDAVREAAKNIEL